MQTVVRSNPVLDGTLQIAEASRHHKPMTMQARTSMKMMLTLALLALSISSTLGFIGATEKQCRKKYSGKVSTVAVEPLADKTLIWKNNNNEVLASFIDGLAHFVIYVKAGGAKFEDSEVKQIMKDNGDGLGWVEVHGTSSWIRTDRKILLTKDSKMNAYTLATTKWMDLQKKKGTSH
jgi:hypothetical protein